MGDLDGAVATLDLDGNSSRVFSRSSCLLWLPLLDRCWRHVTALLLLLAICPTVMGWNSLGMPYIPSTFCIIFSFLLRSKHVYHHVLHLGLKRLCITMGHCIPCKNHGTLYSYHMYACLFFPSNYMFLFSFFLNCIPWFYPSPSCCRTLRLEIITMPSIVICRLWFNTTWFQSSHFC